jgi:DNA modification methylase
MPYEGLKPKDLIGIPWMLAFALRADGWYLRQDIIWSKPNPMPESVRDRCTKAHEYMFLLSKSARYYYDSVKGVNESRRYQDSQSARTDPKERKASTTRAVETSAASGLWPQCRSRKRTLRHSRLR